MSVSKIPDGYHTVTPYLTVRNAAAAIDFYKQAFGATEELRLEHGGVVGHAEIRIGDSFVMLADEHPDMGMVGPESLGGAGIHLMLYSHDVDADFARAVGAGCETLRPVADQFYGDRTGTLKDPYGHVWSICTHIEDLSGEELQKRFAALIDQ